MPAPTPRTPLPLPLRPFESVWFGVSLLVALLIYMSIGSALPPVRESRLFEMTEFEWFNWWPFAVMGALLCVNLTVVTIRKIPFNLIKLGVWMIHTGIVLLVLTSWWYFAGKVEGDAIVFRRMVEVQTSAGETARFPALPGATATAGDYTFTVANLDPAWPILSGEHEGEEAFSVSVMVTPPDGSEPFIRQLLANYPQYTEDILPGRGRAIKNTGEKLVDASLAMNLAPAPQEWFHLVQTRAFYVRELGETQWTQLPITGLPRYNDYAEAPGRELWLPPGDSLPPAGGLDREIKGFAEATGAPARVTGFVRYAQMMDSVVRSPNGAPAATIEIDSPNGQHRDINLAVGIPGHETSPEGVLAITAVDSAEERNALLQRALPTIRIETPTATTEARVAESIVSNPDLSFTPIAESGFAYRVRLVADDLRMPSGAELSAAVVEIETPEGDRFVRFVSADGSVLQDIETEENGATPRPTTDERITVAYIPGETPAPLTLVVGPDHAKDAALLLPATGAPPELVPMPVGEPVNLPAGGVATLANLVPSAALESRPAVVPRQQRDRAAGDYYSMAQIEIEGDRRWLPFHDYAFESPNFRYKGLRHEPSVFTLKNGKQIEVLFSRERRPLPAAVALDDFILKSHVGGFTGATPTIRDWISHVNFQTETGWSDNVEIRTNHPAARDGLSYFQARWDPPAETGAGFAFTGLGVGSRQGVYAMLASSCLSVLGMIYVFYIKPPIQRRRVQRALAAKAQAPQEPDERLVVVTPPRHTELEEVNA